MAERELTYAAAVNEAIRLAMRRDATVIVMGEDIAGAAGRADQGFIDAWGGPFSTTRGLIQEFGPERVRDTPISEAGFIGAAVGAAATGLRPIADLMFVDFIGVCLDPLLNTASKVPYMFGGQLKIPVTITTKIGAGSGSGATHSGTLYSLFVHIPGLKCVAPSDAYTAKGLLTAAIRDDSPVIVFDHKSLLSRKAMVPEGEYTWPIGKARLLREGKDVSLIGISYMTVVCEAAANLLAQQGISAEVVDVLSLSPLDEDTILSSIRKTRRVVIVDEDNPRCGMAADIAALVADKAFDYLDAPVKCVTAPHTPVPASRVLEGAYIPNEQKVVGAVKLLLG